ncbi:MAG: hypothetical protein ACK5HY_13955, partial [Parahaliea sp.]
YSDLQLFTFVNTGGLPTQVLTNASVAEVYGMEAEMDWQATEQMGIRLGVGLLESELQDYQSVTGDDFSGNELPQSPGYSVAGLVYYDIPLNSGAVITLQTDFSYQDDVFFLNDNNPLLSQEAYGLVNARVSFRTASENFELALWGKNLAGEDYLSAAFDLSDFGLYQLMRGADTTYGAEVTYRF